jgi:hypothetical protein
MRRGFSSGSSMHITRYCGERVAKMMDKFDNSFSLLGFIDNDDMGNNK